MLTQLVYADEYAELYFPAGRKFLSIKPDRESFIILRQLFCASLVSRMRDGHLGNARSSSVAYRKVALPRGEGHIVSPLLIGTGERGATRSNGVEETTRRGEESGDG